VKVHAEEVAENVATLSQPSEGKTIGCRQLSSKLNKAETQQIRAQGTFFTRYALLRLLANNSSFQNSFHANNHTMRVIDTPGSVLHAITMHYTIISLTLRATDNI